MPKEYPSRRDLHAEITNQLVAAIEANPGEPSLPWRRAGSTLSIPTNALTGKAYQGINILNLWVAATIREYDLPVWGTYRQWAERGCQVRRGEKSSLVIFYREFDADPNTDDQSDNGKRRVARASWVFNAAQVDGFEFPPVAESLGPVERIANADRFVGQTGARVEHGGQQAYFRRDTDHIQMPDESLFVGSDTMNRNEAYYSVLVHELVHWSGAKPRLDRDLGKRFGDEAYAAEELVAEIGAAFLCAELGITQEVRPDHAQYLANWLRLLKDDNRAIFAAAARAGEAANYLRSLGSGS